MAEGQAPREVATVSLKMNSLERIEAAIHGQSVDRVPIALWCHFPHVDQTAEGLARAVIDFQKKFDFDLVKVTPASGYMAEAWGAKLVPKDNDEGTRDYLSRPVQRPQDWHTLQRLDVAQGILGRELKALQLIRREISSDVPVLQTIFSPLTTARNLAGERWLSDLREHPDDLKTGLDVIVETTIKFARTCLKAGADGLFFATQLASYDFLTEDEYRAFGVEYDRQVLDAIKDQAKLVVLHIHGLNIMFDLLKEYPVQILNWHDRRTSPSLIEAQKRFKGAVLGGLNEWDVLLKGKPEDVKAQVKDALTQTGGRRFILGAGCVIAVTTPDENIRAARQAVE